MGTQEKPVYEMSQRENREMCKQILRKALKGRDKEFIRKAVEGMP